MRAAKILLLAIALPALAGCGQTGVLYFDEAPPADQLPPSRKQAGGSPLPVVPPAATADAPVDAPLDAATPPPAAAEEKTEPANP